MRSGVVTPEHVEAYRHDGVVFLPQVIEERWLDLIAIGFERATSRNPGPFAEDYPHGRGRDGRLFMDFYNFFVNPEYRKVLYDSPVVDILADLMESRGGVALLRADLLQGRRFGGADGLAPGHADVQDEPE